jgi:phage terminase small subunit
MAKLNDRQKKFCEEYLIDLNATQAAKRAGYSERTAYSKGQQLLKKVEIQEYLQHRRKDQQIRTEITQDRVLQELASIGFARGTDYAQVTKFGTVALTPTDQLSKDQKAAVTGVKETKDGVEIKLADKVKALELLGKHLGMFDGPGSDKSAEDRISDYLNALEDTVKNEPK